MAWLIAKSYSFGGPPLHIIDNPDGTKLFNNIGASSSLPWPHGSNAMTARYDRPWAGKPDDMFLVDGMVAVSGALHDLIESFEPGIHAFVPLRLERRDGEVVYEDFKFLPVARAPDLSPSTGTPIEGRYYLFSAQQDVDCVVTDNDPELFEDLGPLDGGRRHLLCRVREPYRPITLSRPQIAGRHLWTGGLLCWNELFCSDAFKAAVETAELGFVEFNRECSLVEHPWVGEEQMGMMLSQWRGYVASGRQYWDRSL
jgi:hypothetical protein